MDKRKFNGGQKGCGRKSGIGISYDIQKYCNDFIVELLKNDSIRNKAIKQINLQFELKKESIYIIKDNNYYKIGYSSDFKKRVKSYKTHTPNASVIYYAECENSSNIEREIHKMFRHKVKQGEWLELSNDDLIVILKYINTIIYGW